MELMEVIRQRRAVRDFKETRIERATVQNLIDAAILAPSAMNLQPWAFAVILGREGIDRYAMRARTWLLENFSQTGHDASLRKVLEDPQHVLFYHAPALVLVCATSSETQSREDCCLVAENVLLVARARVGHMLDWISSCLARFACHQDRVENPGALRCGCTDRSRPSKSLA